MPDTYSSILGTLKMAVGGDSNSWGTNCTDSVFAILEQAICGYETHSVTGGTTDLSTTTPPAGATTALKYLMAFSGNLGSDHTIQVPNAQKTWLVYNSCTLNGHVLKMKTASGSATTIPPGHCIMWCDGSNNIYLGPQSLSTSLQLGDGSAFAPTYSFSGETNSGWYRAGAGDIRLSVTGSDEIQVTTGAIALNENTTVAGTLHATGNATLDGTLDVTGTATLHGAASVGTTLGVTGATTLTGVLQQNATSYEGLPSGTTGQRPGSPAAANFRYNSTLGCVEFYDGTVWWPTIGSPAPSGFKNLLIANNTGTPNTKYDVTADYVCAQTASGVGYGLNTVSVTIDCGTTGANGLDTGGLANSTPYFIYIIYNPATGTVAGLMSLSATAPTMPAGYTAKARLGWAITDSSAHFLRTRQAGRTGQYVIGTNPTVVPNIANGVAGTYSATAPTLTAVSVTGVVPSTASRILVIAVTNWKNGSVANLLVAPNTGYGGSNNGPTGSAGQTYPIWIPGAAAPVSLGVSAWIELEATTIAWASSSNGGAIACLGWEDNI